jgi:hypothetical protein
MDIRIMIVAPTMIRYTPKERNPNFVRNEMKALIANNATIKAIMFPTINS